MNLKLPSLILLGFTLLLVNPATAQKRIIKKTTPHVIYKENVSQPFTATELAQINEVYGDQADEYVFSIPQRVRFIKNLLRNRLEIREIPNQSDHKLCPLLSEIPLCDYYVHDLKRDLVFNPQTFNPLKYLFDAYAKGGKMYRVDNTNYFIFIKSQFKQ